MNLLKINFLFTLIITLASLGCTKDHSIKINTGGGVNPTNNTGKQYGKTHGYPEDWWIEINDPKKPDWEVLPQEAKAGEVILSKRTELGILSNFAATPFTFRGKTYASLEGFWQATKYPEDAQDERLSVPEVKWPFTRAQVEQMVGFEAKEAGSLASQNMKLLGIDWVTFEKKKLVYKESGDSDFYRLIRQVMLAKVLQNKAVFEILLNTKDLKLLPDHQVKSTEPKAWHYYQIWMEIREELKKQKPVDYQ